MSRHTREELLDLAAGYALGAASPEEAAAVERAMSEMPDVAAEVVAHREVAVQLAAQRAVAPSPELRDRLLARVSEMKVVPLAVVAPAPTVRRGVPRWLAVGLAASLVAAAGLAYQNVMLRGTLDRQVAELGTARQTLAVRQQTLDAVLEAEKDLYVAQLVGSDTAKGPSIQLFWNAKQQRGVLHAFRLRPAPAGRSYQLWLLVNGKPVSAKVFNSEADGHALVENIALPATTNGVTQVLLTEEPAGGSPGPTTTPFLGGTLAKT